MEYAKKDERNEKAVVLPFERAHQKARKLRHNVERKQAQEIAERLLKKTGRNELYVERVVAPYQLSGRLPAVYGIELDNNCWIAYLRPSEDSEWLPVLKSSEIVIVSRTSGRVLYFGSANDEG